MKLICILAVAVCATSVFASAQAASIKIGDETFSCPAAKEIGIKNKGRLYGFADPVDRLIVLDQRKLITSKPFFRRFVFLHECGHLHVGLDEIKADCWAIERGSEQGWLTTNHVGYICKRLGGGKRCQALQRCYRSAEQAGGANSFDQTQNTPLPLEDRAAFKKRKIAAQVKEDVSQVEDVKEVKGRSRSAELNLRVNATVMHSLTELARARGLSTSEMLEKVLREWKLTKLTRPNMR